MNTIWEDAKEIAAKAIKSCLPDEAVRRALKGREFPKPVTLISIGKAAFRMADAALGALGSEKIAQGAVLTKYGHIDGPIGSLKLFEAGHPVLDKATLSGTEQILQMIKGLEEGDTVLFLVSGGGSALFEMPLIPLEELAGINRQLLSSGASIQEMNTVRKHLSAVKGGRFAKRCAPANVFSVVLSDVIGDRLDVIASGPAYPDASTSKEAIEIVLKYGLDLSAQAERALREETPKTLSNVETVVTGSVKELCRSAMECARALGYRPFPLTESLDCEAREAGRFLAAIGRDWHGDEPAAFIAGGETVVKLTGKGLGGRNQELALAAAEGLDGLSEIVLLSAGSDGTDGPTDAAGGIVDGGTAGLLREKGISITEALKNNDSYHALEAAGGLYISGPTGTNVNDLQVLLIRPVKTSG